jgi:hypothetical protein
MTAKEGTEIRELKREFVDFKKEFGELAKSHNEMRIVVFNGLRDKVKDLHELLPKLMVLLPKGGVRAKPPKRMEYLTVLIGVLLGLQTLGVFDGLRLLIRTWIQGG